MSAAAAALFAIMPDILRPREAAAGADPIDTLWSDPANARTVGRRYLQMQPTDVAVDPMMQDVFGDRMARGEIDAESLRTAIAERRLYDFASGDTVIIDGWLLSRTEARLCALSVLDYGYAGDA